MKIDDPLILKLENLARLELSESERLQIKTDLQNILDMVEKLQELDTDGVEPLRHLTSDHISPRADISKNSGIKSKALGLGPQHNENFFVIPKIIDKS